MRTEHTPASAEAAERRVNPVALLSAGIGLLALISVPGFSPDWLLFKANRLVAGEAFAPHALSGGWTLALLGSWFLVALLGLRRVRGRAWWLAGAAAAALVVALLFTGAAANALLVDARSSARVSLQGGVWLTALAYYICLYAALLEAESTTSAWRNVLLVAPGLLLAVALVGSGRLDGLGLAQELANGAGDFRDETLRHLALASTSVLLATLIGVPAAIWAARRRAVANVVLPTVSLLQTLPSLALFGLMLGPLARLGRELSVGGALLIIGAGLGAALLLGLGSRASGPRLRLPLLGLTSLVALAPLALLSVLLAVVLNDVLVALFAFDVGGLDLWSGFAAPLAEVGVRGIGTAPALIALTLYALLPIVRNTYTGIREVPAAATEAGRGMGMSPGQLLRRVELPLALPLIIEGLRASAVLTIGIATVAYLIGAGGLGTFIQRGIDQVVPDLILLGALPVIGLALLADGLLRLLGRSLTPRALREAGS